MAEESARKGAKSAKAEDDSDEEVDEQSSKDDTAQRPTQKLQKFIVPC